MPDLEIPEVIPMALTVHIQRQFAQVTELVSVYVICFSSFTTVYHKEKRNVTI